MNLGWCFRHCMGRFQGLRGQGWVRCSQTTSIMAWAMEVSKAQGCELDRGRKHPQQGPQLMTLSRVSVSFLLVCPSPITHPGQGGTYHRPRTPHSGMLGLQGRDCALGQRMQACP